jgi:hypothetical protein
MHRCVGYEDFQDIHIISVKKSLESCTQNATATYELTDWVVLLQSSINLEQVSS